MLLDAVYGCASLASHTEEEVPWEALPPDFVLQIHQRPSASFRNSLENNAFRIIVLARHPLDVLVSILHFSGHEPATARWLEGEGGDETEIAGCTPVDPSFLAYGTGPRAKALLAVSHEWWSQEDVLRAKYEDFYDDTLGQLAGLSSQIGAPRSSIEAAVRAHSPNELRRIVPGHHVWQARPGNWRSLLPASVAHTIAEAHPESFDSLGYEVDADPNLDATSALANWERIATPATTQPTDWATAAYDSAIREIRSLRAWGCETQKRLEEEGHARREAERMADALRTERADLEERLRAEQARSSAAEAAAARVVFSRSFRYTASLRDLAGLLRGRPPQITDESSGNADVKSPR
jgi:hypothetical protein